MPLPSKFLLSHQDLMEWFKEYNTCTNLDFKNVNVPSFNWKKCYSSPLPRAKMTAMHYCTLDIETNTALLELNILNRTRSRIKLPFLIWAMLIRAKSSNKNITQEYENRLSNFLDEVLFQTPEEDLLIVSHYFTMKMLRKELLRRGFKNSSYKPNAYGEVFVFEK